MISLPTPTNGSPHSLVRVSLSGSTYAIEWHWNTRASMWTFSMFKPDGSRLVSGVPVVLNTDLLAWAPKSLDRPPYALVVADTTGGASEPTLETLGKQIKVIYLEPST